MNQQPAQDRQLPRVEDLRSRKCFICLEEDDYLDSPNSDWVHPCACQYIAHKRCLLQWIDHRISNSPKQEFNTERIPEEVMCPLCRKPFMISLKKNRYMTLVRYVRKTMEGLADAASIAVPLFVILQVDTFNSVIIGSCAVRLFFGEHIYNIMQASRPETSISTSLSLAMIPLSLLIHRANPFVWMPVTFPRCVQDLTYFPTPQQLDPSTAETLYHYAPSPAFFSYILLPIVRYTYEKHYTRLRQKILSIAQRPPHPQQATLPLTGLARLAGRYLLRRPFDDQDRQLVQRLREIANDDRADGEAGLGAAEGILNENMGNMDLLRAGKIITLYCVGAMAIPVLANGMGRALRYFVEPGGERGLGGNVFARAFLGIPSAVPSPLSCFPEPDYDALVLRGERDGIGKARYCIAYVPFAFVKYCWTGEGIWAPGSGLEAVWWRNVIGLGIFAVGRDVVKLAYSYYKVREVKTRRGVKSRPFDMHLLDEKDLVPGYMEAGTQEIRKNSMDTIQAPALDDPSPI